MDNRKKAARKPITRALNYQAVFKTSDGQKVLWDLMKNHHMISPTFSKDTHEMALKEGERNVVLRIMQILKINVDSLAKKIEEGLKEESENN
jgi:hypothetical protein